MENLGRDSIYSRHSPLLYRLLLSGHSWQFTLPPSRFSSLAFYNTKNEGEIGYYINRRLTFHSCFRQFSECPPCPWSSCFGRGGNFRPVTANEKEGRRNPYPATVNSALQLVYTCRWLCVWPSRDSAHCCAFTQWLIIWFYELGQPLEVSSRNWVSHSQIYLAKTCVVKVLIKFIWINCKKKKKKSSPD